MRVVDTLFKECKHMWVMMNDEKVECGAGVVRRHAVESQACKSKKFDHIPNEKSVMTLFCFCFYLWRWGFSV